MPELFDYLKALTEKNEFLNFDDEEIKKGYNCFLINRFVSMAEVFTQVVNEINRFPDIPKETHFRYLFSILPKRKQFFKYIKKKKDLSQTEKIIIANHFEVGLTDAERYINILSEKEIKEILELYRYGKNSLAGV